LVVIGSERLSPLLVVLIGPERLEQARDGVAQGRVLPRGEAHLLSQVDDLQGPEAHPEGPGEIAGAGQVAEDDEGGEAGARRRLRDLQGNGDRLAAARGARPLDQQTLVLAPERQRGAVVAQGREPEEGIEREAAERAGMAAQAEVALEEDGLGEE